MSNFDSLKKKVKRVTVDADILMFEAAHKAEGTFYYYPEEEFFTPVKREMDTFCKFNKLDPSLVESCKRPMSFKVAEKCLLNRIAEIEEFFGEDKEYKGNRLKQKKPHYLQDVRDYIIEHFPTQEAEGQEADDLAGILQDEHTCALSTDKDWNTFPGLHAMWTTPWSKEFKMWEVSEIDALRNFYCQIIIGDDGDNILGLHGIGKDSTYLKKIREMDNEADMFKLCYQLYYQRFRNYASKFLLETGRLLWIRRNPDELWEFPKGVYESLPDKLRN